LRPVPAYLLTHSHEPGECASAFAAWHGFASPLRRTVAISSCLAEGHSLWWRVDAVSPEDALALLPPFVAERSEVAEIREVTIP
jgi:hypothetical protein